MDFKNSFEGLSMPPNFWELDFKNFKRSQKVSEQFSSTVNGTQRGFLKILL